MKALTNISVLGATGSIGTQTLEVIEQHSDRFRLLAMSIGKNIELGLKQIHKFRPKLVSVMNKTDYDRLIHEVPQGVKVVYGEEGLIEVATHDDGDIVVNAVIGSVGLVPTLKAIEAKKTIALANKETLVTAGHLVTKKAKEFGVPLIPVDSEHSAIFQCLQGEKRSQVAKMILTASGGSFRDKTREELKTVTVSDALKHPNWSMGAKITIDSATMMNKGLEIIEAHWLFAIDYDDIEVLIHRESIIHSMVEFIDGSVMAQLGLPDMRLPIQYALSYPERLEMKNRQRLKLSEIGKLHFAEVDDSRYPCLKMAYEAGRAGGTMPAVLNAANEEAVSHFLRGAIHFLQIEEWINRALHKHNVIKEPSLEEILEVDEWTRKYVQSFVD